MQWNYLARNKLEGFLDDVRINLASSDVDDASDPDEVAEDMRRHVYAELADQQVEVVTPEVLEPILLALDPKLADGSHREQLASSSGPQKKQRSTFADVVVFFSVVLSYMALLVESLTHFCAEHFFDPIPTLWHWLIVFSVPTSMLCFACTEKISGKRELWCYGIASGVSVGISAHYSLLFLPLLPLAAIGVVVVVGLLGMSPFFALITAIIMRRRLRTATVTGAPLKIPGLMIGGLLGFLTLPATDLPRFVTDYGIRVAASDDPGKSVRGVAFLRTFGSEDRLLKACYIGSPRTPDAVSVGLRLWSPVRQSAARKIYYRVTGRAFNSVNPPSDSSADWLRNPEFGRAAWVERRELGSSEVSGRNFGLTLDGSRIDTEIRSSEGTAYTEWTMTFGNSFYEAREARAQIALPVGSVVSRLTLWVNDEEREAAFASTSKTRDAYQSVVRQRLDPVLVTTSGKDRVLMQCFPVPPGGGMIKVRLGITSPLHLDQSGRAVLGMASFTERNFKIHPRASHRIWIESDSEIRGSLAELTYEKPARDNYTARGSLDDLALTNPEAMVSVASSHIAKSVRVKETHGEGSALIVQELVPSQAEGPERVMIVVDGSRGMRELQEPVANALRFIPETVELGLIVAGDVALELVDPAESYSDREAEVADSIRAHEFIGGTDLVPALIAAWDRCVEVEDSLVVIIHGSQPVELDSLESIRQILERRSGGPKVLTVRAARGPNRVLRELNDQPGFSQIPRTGSLEDDLQSLFEGWGGAERSSLVRREVSSDSATDLGNVPLATRHVSRLWANEEVHRARRMKADGWRDKAVELAAHYQLVTPVSGAVVLESAAQFAAASGP